MSFNRSEAENILGVLESGGGPIIDQMGTGGAFCAFVDDAHAHLRSALEEIDRLVEFSNTHRALWRESDAENTRIEEELEAAESRLSQVPGMVEEAFFEGYDWAAEGKTALRAAWRQATSHKNLKEWMEGGKDE